MRHLPISGHPGVHGLLADEWGQVDKMRLVLREPSAGLLFDDQAMIGVYRILAQSILPQWVQKRKSIVFLVD